MPPYVGIRGVGQDHVRQKLLTQRFANNYMDFSTESLRADN